MSVRPIRGRQLVIVGIAVTVLVGAGLWLHTLWVWRGLTDYPMEHPRDIPTAVAVGQDGVVWFTLDFADAIGVFRQGRIQRVPKGRDNLEPLVGAM